MLLNRKPRRHAGKRLAAATSRPTSSARRPAQPPPLEPAPAAPLSLLDKRIEIARQRLESLSRRTRSAASSSETGDALRALADALDELRAAGEELRQQNEELAAARQGLEAERQRYRDLFDFAPDGYLVTGPTAVILEANQAVALLLHVPSDQLVGQPLRGYVARQDRSLFSERLASLRQGRSARWRMTLLPHGGPEVPVEVEVAPGRGEIGLDSLRWLLRDVSERLRTEGALRERDEQLRQSQRIEAIGRLAGGVAHDFNNLLSVIIGNAEVSLRHLAAPDASRRYTEQILQASHKAAALTHQLLTFSRKQRLAPRTVDLNTAVAGSDAMLRRLIGEDIEFVTELPIGVCLVNADPAQLEQVVMNLCLNARDAMPRGGRLSVRTASVQVDEEEASQQGGQPGPHALLEVSDTGTGISPEIRDQIFEPYFTTKGKGKGTGLGLATVYGVVRQAGGFVVVESTPDAGSTFRVLLPSVPVTPPVADRPSVAPKPAPDDVQGGSETVMVVEDEEMVREMVCQILSLAGYRVIAATGPGDALRVLEDPPQPVDLLLTDVVMPEMSGPELVARVTAIHPGMKSFFMSGYAEGSLGRYSIPAAGNDLLEKPFTADSLLLKVREVLDSR